MKTGNMNILKYIAGLAMIVSMTGCGIFSKSPPPAIGPTGASSGAGGFYKDDGPGLLAPSNLEEIPDAVPRMEPLLSGPMRPYVVLGKGYVPMTRLEPYKDRGIATWYGRRYHGKPTSSGEAYDMYAMTAAHTVLPIPSYVRVTNLANKKSVVVRVNDRGPFIGNRLIDLSYTAAYKLGLATAGSGMVEVEVIIPGAPPVVKQPPVATAKPLAAPTIEVAALPPVAPVAAARIAPATAAAGGSYLQFGAFGVQANAESYLARVQSQADWLSGTLRVHSNDGVFRVQAGPFANEAAAREAAERAGQLLGTKPVLVTR